MTMYHLISKPSFGKLTLSGTPNEEIYDIGEGRLSITPKDNFYLLNFWIRTEYDYKMPNGELIFVSGPTLEILTKINENKFDVLDISMPKRAEIQDEWDVNYRTGYYRQYHQFFDNASLILNHMQGNLFKITFSGVPSEDGQHYTVKGTCELKLENELKRYW